MGWTSIWPMIIGALIHEAGTVIQALKPVCQFMAGDIPPPVLNQLVTRYLFNLLVGIREPSSPTGWPQSPQLQTEDTKKSQKLDCVATGFIYDNAVNFTVDVRLSVTPCSLCFHHRIIVNFLGVITIDKSDVHAKDQGRRSKVKVTEVKINFALIWAFADCNSSSNSHMATKRCKMMLSNVICQISRSHSTKYCRFWLIWAFPDCNSCMNSQMATKWCKAWSSRGEVSYCFSRLSVKFQGHTGQKVADFDPNWVFPDCNSSLNFQMAKKWCTKLKLA